MSEYIEREKINYEQWSVGPLNEPLMVARKKTIDSIPAADVAPVRHGRWIPEYHEDRVSPTMKHKFTLYNCSECGRRLIGYSNPSDAPYCHCGAKMDGDTDVT